MKLIIGLGNPGSTYARTRHNAGFLVVDELAKRTSAQTQSKKALEAEIAQCDIKGQTILLCKPQAFMNVSGRAVQKVMKKFPIKADDLLVVYDDADLPFGEVRMKNSGSSAGHRGMESILETFPPSTNIARVRIGIGRPDHPDIALEDFVLQKWSEKEELGLVGVIEKAVGLIVEWVKK